MRNESIIPTGVVPPPPGITPNFDHPVKEPYWRVHLAGLIVCDALVTLFFALRCYAKATIAPKILVEDVTCAISWALLILYTATVFMMIRYGEGYNAWDVTRENYREILKWLYASSVLYCPAAYFTKATILLLIARVFAIRTRVVRGLHIFIIILLVCYLPIQVIKTIVCLPIRAYWDPESAPHARCLNQRKVFISDLSLAIVTDFVIILVPVPLTWSLTVSLRKKIKIIALLGAGGVATAVTVFRMVKVIDFLHSTNVTHDFALLDLTTTIEVTIGLICACLPSVNLLIEKHIVSRYSSSHHLRPPDPNAPRTKIPWRKYKDWWSSHFSSAASTLVITTTTTSATTPANRAAGPGNKARIPQTYPARHHYHHYYHHHHHHRRGSSNGTSATVPSVTTDDCGIGIGGADDDFDVERQIRSGRAIELGNVTTTDLQRDDKSTTAGGESVDGGGGCGNNKGRRIERGWSINSDQGRREGWLIDEGEEREEGEGDATSGVVRGGGIRRTVEVSLQHSRIGPGGGLMPVPDRIWDGTLPNAVSRQAVGTSSCTSANL
ncbi:integral membrane protein [Xylariomycetidae sp. FL2044]|nr:integral membrane protein [Xylariomycetidae sp. FL2044]